jgi:hypothetical protein
VVNCPAVLYLPIRRSWLFSIAAQRTYFMCAVLSVAFVATKVGVRVAMTAFRISALDPRSAFLVRGLLYPEILGTALLWIAMLYFWFGFDKSHYIQKAFWFVCLAVLAPFGPITYYFAVYRRSAAREGIATNFR